jgi:uncharacterized phage protein (TIGR01671 family)
MRTIKFRAWDKENLEWWYKFCIDSAGELWIFENKELEIPIKDRFVLTQYTGLKDKNGKEIYEGDIVKSFNGAIGKVEWELIRFALVPIKGLITGLYQEKSVSEVIGNIYENPDLLNQKSE